MSIVFEFTPLLCVIFKGNQKDNHRFGGSPEKKYTSIHETKNTYHAKPPIQERDRRIAVRTLNWLHTVQRFTASHRRNPRQLGLQEVANSSHGRLSQATTSCKIGEWLLAKCTKHTRGSRKGCEIVWPPFSSHGRTHKHIAPVAQTACIGINPGKAVQ